MEAKTIFLTLEEEFIYNSILHSNNHADYIKKYYSNLKITDYIPILLTKYDNCVIDLSNSYKLGVIYLPYFLSEFQKKFFVNNKKFLVEYTLYLNGHSLQTPILLEELLNIIYLKPTKPKEKKL